MAWNKPSENNAEKRLGHRKSQPILRGLFAGAVVVAGAVVIWMLAKGVDESVPAEDRRPARTKDAKPMRTSIESSVSSGKRAESATLPNAADMQVLEQQEEKKPGVFAPGMIRLPNGFELRFRLPAEGETRQLLAGGEIWEIDSKGNIENVTPPPIFEKPFEGMISGLYERDGMVLPFALKRYSEEEVRKMCKEPTLSYDDDGGGKFEEFVDDMQEHSKKALHAQAEGMHGVRDLLLAGKDEDAVLYYKLFSQDMAEKGYVELKLPPSYRAALEEIAARENGRK